MGMIDYLNWRKVPYVIRGVYVDGFHVRDEFMPLTVERHYFKHHMISKISGVTVRNDFADGMIEAGFAKIGKMIDRTK